MTVLDMATIVCIGLMIGVEFAVSAFINPVLWRLERGAQMEAIRIFAVKLGFVMPFWYGLGLVLLLVQTFMVRHQAAVAPAAVASGGAHGSDGDLSHVCEIARESCRTSAAGTKATRSATDASGNGMISYPR